MNSEKKLISVCICTFRRPHLLENLISKLEKQITNAEFRFEVVITDNDPDRSGAYVFEKLKDKISLDIAYFHQPERSISLARNKCIDEAKGEFIAFIDDDEFPKDDWLLNLFNAISNYSADGVLGPVNPYIDGRVPNWLVKSGLVHRKSFKSGYVIKNSSHTRTGNAILRSELFKGQAAPFDPKYGKIGGGDVDFFHRMMLQKKVFVWCDEAVVYEIINPDRRRRKYYLKRSFTRGITNSWKTPFISLGTLKSVIAIPLYSLILPFCAISGQHHLMKYTVKLCDHLGKILGYIGIRLVKERPYQL